MRKLLLAYQINDQTLGIDLDTWDDVNLNGNTPFKLIQSGDTIPSGYTNITSIVNLDSIGIGVANDYLCIKFEIKELVDEIGWTGLTNTEKDLAIQYYAYPDSTSAVIYLMTTKGLSQAEAQGYILTKWHIHHGKVLETCIQRWYYVKFIIPQYLNFADSEDLFDTGQQLIFEYIQMGRLGIDYGDNNDGLMDYLMSTNAFEGQGMEENNYTLLSGTWEEFRTQIKNVLVEGIYNKYQDYSIYY